MKGRPHASDISDRQFMRRTTIRKGRRRRQDQDSGTSSASQILHAAVREDCSPGELADMACADPIFAGRVLAWVNSPTFALSRTITDVRQATGLLGIRGLRNIALSMLVSGMAPSSPRSAVLLANGLRRALAAHCIAEYVAREQADSAFTTGLFLDAGLLALSANDVDVAAGLAEGSASHRVIKERAFGLTPHPEAGAQLAVGYGLPADMVHAIVHHHDELAPTEPLSRVAWAAERLAAVFEGGSLEGARAAAVHAAEVIGLHSDALDDLLRLLPQMVADGAKIFARDVGPQPSIDELAYDANIRLVQINGEYEQMVTALQAAVKEADALTCKLQEANERLRILAEHDPLTGLVNRRVFNSKFQSHVTQAADKKTYLSVAMLDLDRFKKVNDQYGHDMGDQVLKVVAEVLKDSVRGMDIVARFGGEEFVVVLPNTDSEEAATVFEAIRARIEATRIVLGGVAIRVTASIGGAGVAVHAAQEQAKGLLKRADAALYVAKAEGRNRCVMSKAT